MPLNFPASPTDGQIYTDDATGNKYTYVASFGYWSSATSAAGGSGGGFYQGNDGNIAPENYGDIFRSHTNTLTANTTIQSGNNSIAAGPITVASGAVLVIEDGARVSIV